MLCKFGATCLKQLVLVRLQHHHSSTLCKGVIACSAAALWQCQHLTDKAGLYCSDASRASVLEAAGISKPRALAVVYTARARLVSTVHSLREHFPNVSSSLLQYCLKAIFVLLMHVFAVTILFMKC